MNKASAKIQIRQATPSDIRGLAELHVAAWKVAYKPILKAKHMEWVSVTREIRRLRKSMKEKTPTLLAERKGDLAGFIVYENSDDVDEGLDIHSFWVHHDLTRQGIGGYLLKEMIRCERPAEIRVWALTGVTAGPSFYEKHGFVADETTRRDFIFLGDPLPMVQYCKKYPSRIRRKK